MFFFFLDPSVMFGRRIAALRKQAGLTQGELGEKIGATRRMIAYYERETTQAPAGAVVKLAEVFNITTDELLGVKPSNPEHITVSLKRLQAVEKLDPKTKKQLFQIIDTFIQADKLEKAQIGKIDGGNDDDSDGGNGDDTVTNDFVRVKKLS